MCVCVFIKLHITVCVCALLHCFVLFLLSFWCPCMAINNVSIQYNGGLLPDILLLTQCYLHRETRLKEEVLYLQPSIPPKLFYAQKV